MVENGRIHSSSQGYVQAADLDTITLDQHAALVDGFQTSFEIELPVDKPHARWYHAAFHSTCAVVGAGVLGLPYAFSFLGWAAGLITLTVLCTISLYTSWILAQLHEDRGRRYNTYREIGESIWGPKRGFWAVVPVQYALMIGLCITYAVTAGQSLKGMESAECTGADCQDGIAPWIVLFGITQLALSQLPNFHSLWWVSLLGAVCSIGYCAIAAGASASYAASNPSPPRERVDASAADEIFGILNALGGIAFTFGGQAVLPEIQATLASPPPTFRSMMYGVGASYVIVVSAYFSVAIAGYAAFGGAVAADVLLSVHRPLVLVDIANFMVVLHVAAGYQIFAMPIFEALEGFVRKKMATPPRPIALRLVLRSAFVVGTIFVGCLIPFFGDLMGLIASIGLMPVTFILPPLLWIGSGRATSQLEVSINAAIAGGAMVLALLAFVGSTRNIIVHAGRYNLFD